MAWFAPRQRWARADWGNMVVTLARDRTLEAAIDAAERYISVSRCTANRIERDVPPDPGEVRSKVNALVDAIRACRYSVAS